MFKKDQKVWCAVFGEGTVTAIVQGPFPVQVAFETGDSEVYTRKGFYFNRESHQMLFPYPVKIVPDIAEGKPSIDWSHVSPEYNYLAQDSNGDGYLCGKNPHRMRMAWSMETPIRATAFTSYVPGTCNWKESLVKRPN